MHTKLLIRLARVQTELKLSFQLHVTHFSGDREFRAHVERLSDTESWLQGQLDEAKHELTAIQRSLGLTLDGWEIWGKIFRFLIFEEGFRAARRDRDMHAFIRQRDRAGAAHARRAPPRRRSRGHLAGRADVQSAQTSVPSYGRIRAGANSRFQISTLRVK